ncbi:MAG: hypothetical protein LVQ95_00440 [Candidatus Micrarchaeales archaeon]|nr:hypothetical protein [Candidatus Micrarchaeales archaeon]
MRLIYIVAGAIVLLLSYFVSYTSAAGGSTVNPGGQISFTINESINNTIAYIGKVQNESYLIFYPDLSKADAYLSEAINVSSKNVTKAQVLLSKAQASASQQENYLNENRPLAFAAVGILTIISAVALFVVARPMKKSSARKKQLPQ